VDKGVRNAGMALAIYFGLLLLIFLIVGLHWFIGPTTPTEKKDFVQLLVVIFGGLIGFAGAYFAWRNLRHNQRMLQFTQDNEAQKAQDAAIQEYITQIGNLLFNDQIPVNEKTHLLIRMHTLTIFRRLDGNRKGSTLMF
jgi:ABC-type nickel/cobalt efflux system permease component RcnA